MSIYQDLLGAFKAGRRGSILPGRRGLAIAALKKKLNQINVSTRFMPKKPVGPAVASKFLPRAPATQVTSGQFIPRVTSPVTSAQFVPRPISQVTSAAIVPKPTTTSYMSSLLGELVGEFCNDGFGDPLDDFWKAAGTQMPGVGGTTPSDVETELKAFEGIQPNGSVWASDTEVPLTKYAGSAVSPSADGKFVYRDGKLVPVGNPQLTYPDGTAAMARFFLPAGNVSVAPQPILNEGNYADFLKRGFEAADEYGWTARGGSKWYLRDRTQWTCRGPQGPDRIRDANLGRTVNVYRDILSYDAQHAERIAQDGNCKADLDFTPGRLFVEYKWPVDFDWTNQNPGDVAYAWIGLNLSKDVGRIRWGKTPAVIYSGGGTPSTLPGRAWLDLNFLTYVWAAANGMPGLSHGIPDLTDGQGTIDQGKVAAFKTKYPEWADALGFSSSDYMAMVMETGPVVGTSRGVNPELAKTQAALLAWQKQQEALRLAAEEAARKAAEEAAARQCDDGGTYNETDGKCYLPCPPGYTLNPTDNNCYFDDPAPNQYTEDPNAGQQQYEQVEPGYYTDEYGYQQPEYGYVPQPGDIVEGGERYYQGGGVAQQLLPPGEEVYFADDGLDPTWEEPIMGVPEESPQNTQPWENPNFALWVEGEQGMFDPGEYIQTEDENIYDSPGFDERDAGW